MKNTVVLLLLIFFVQTAVHSQKIIRLYNEKAPGSEEWNWTEQETKIGKNTIVYNVSNPTLTVFEAEKSVATGTAIIICPGGGFHMLSMDSEGYDVAKWLNGKGVTADKSAELHIYAIGNHGFGMRKQNIPTDTWIERLYDWMKTTGY